MVWHSDSESEIYEELDASDEGLKEEEAERRLEILAGPGFELVNNCQSKNLM